MHVIYAAHGWFFRRVSTVLHLILLSLFRGHLRRKIPTFLSCFLAVCISDIRSLIISHVVEIHLGLYETFFRGFRCGFVIWSLLPFFNAGSDFRQLRYVPCIRRNWATTVDQIALCVTTPHELVFGRSNDVSLAHGIVGIGVPKIVWLVGNLSCLCGTLAIACRQSTNVICI